MTTIALKSIGCRTNQEEIAALGSKLKTEGYDLVNNSVDAEITIVNTCSVTGRTEAKTIRLIKSLARKSPNVKILVTGCLAQQIPEELLKIKGVYWVVGNTHKNDIPQILNKGERGLYYSPLNSGKLPIAMFNNYPIDPRNDWRTRFPVKIQEGCDYRCSYCIVPILRGPSRSVSRSDVLKMCKRALQAGYKEIVFTGTHIGQYSDSKTYKLMELLDDVLTISQDFRLRFSSLDPRDCTDEILHRIETEKRICKHVHISVQSLSPDVLTGMNRVYKEYDTFIERMISFRTRCPDAGIGGDFIVGFPGETEAMFETTLKTVERIGFNYGHVFRFSKRPGTTAAAMDNQLGEKEKTDRSDRLRKHLAAMRRQFIQKQLGTIPHRIIVEYEIPVLGITSNYIRVVIPGVRAKRNTWQNVVLKKYLPDKNRCEAVFYEEK